MEFENVIFEEMIDLESEHTAAQKAYYEEKSQRSMRFKKSRKKAKRKNNLAIQRKICPALTELDKNDKKLEFRCFMYDRKEDKVAGKLAKERRGFDAARAQMTEI